MPQLPHRHQPQLKTRVVSFEAVQACNDIYGADHPYSLAVKNNLANILLDSGRADEAQRIYTEVLHAQLASLGQHHPDTLIVRVNLAVAKAEQGERVNAEELLEEVIQDCHRAFKTMDHPNILAAQYHLARLIEQDGDFEAAYKRYLSIVTLQRKKSENNHPDIVTTQLSLSRVLEGLGRRLEAEFQYQQAIRLATRVAGRDGLIHQHRPQPWIPTFGPPTKQLH